MGCSIRTALERQPRHLRGSVDAHQRSVAALASDAAADVKKCTGELVKPPGGDMARNGRQSNQRSDEGDVDLTTKSEPGDDEVDARTLAHFEAHIGTMRQQNAEIGAGSVLELTQERAGPLTATRKVDARECD